MEEKTGCSTLKRDGNIIGINRGGKKNLEGREVQDGKNYVHMSEQSRA